MVVAHTFAFSAFVASRFHVDHSYSTSNLSNNPSSAFLCRYTKFLHGWVMLILATSICPMLAK
jgi:hypothetical protein